MGSFKEIINQNKPTLVDFFAVWCGPCKTMSPILKETKEALKKTVRIIKIDVDKNPSTASTYQVRSVPTLILFKNGKILWRHSGVILSQELQQIIRQNS